MKGRDEFVSETSHRQSPPDTGHNDLLFAPLLHSGGYGASGQLRHRSGDKSPMVAASLISIIGVVSILGRLVMGAGSDKMGTHNVLILVCGLVVISMLCLIFNHQLWGFLYLCHAFRLCLRRRGPPNTFVSEFDRRVPDPLATLIGLTLFLGNIGGALGPVVAGKIFDMTDSYTWAFTIWMLLWPFLAFGLAIFLKQPAANPTPPKS